MFSCDDGMACVYKYISYSVTPRTALTSPAPAQYPRDYIIAGPEDSPDRWLLPHQFMPKKGTEIVPGGGGGGEV